MPKYSFPTQIVLQERSRDNKALLSQLRFKFTSEFKYWNSYEQPPEICHVDNPLQPLEMKNHQMSATCYRGLTGEDRSGFTHRVKSAPTPNANLRCRMSRIVLLTAMCRNFPT